LKDDKQKGILPRCFSNIFSTISGDSKRQFLVRASYLEIYNEDIQDLLNKKGVNQRLELKDKDSGVYVKDLSTFVVKNPEDMMNIF
jgi:kinesin family protein 3/17